MNTIIIIFITLLLFSLLCFAGWAVDIDGKRRKTPVKRRIVPGRQRNL